MFSYKHFYDVTPIRRMAQRHGKWVLSLSESGTFKKKERAGQVEKMPPEGSLRYDIVATPAGLHSLAAELEAEAVFGVDLEADSMYHFQEKVCLLQIASGKRNVVVDTIALTDLSPLKTAFRSPDIRKVLHGADYDVRCLYRDFDIRVGNLFDTQCACRFLGFKETSLESVVKQLFGVALDKKYQRKDWSRRPLPKEMLAYAATDVRYLLPLAQALEAELAARGRLSWVGEECRLLSKVRPAAGEDGPLFLTCKGAGRLDPRSLAVLEQLLKLRRKIALRKDRPLFKVFNHEALLRLAEARPDDLGALERTGALSPSQIERHGSDILAAIQKALRRPAAELPRYPYKKPKTLPADMSERIRLLRRWRESQARRLKIEPALICSKAAMAAIAECRPSKAEDLIEIPELRHWQRKAFGKELIAALQKER
jgi:ribonuclease D